MFRGSGQRDWVASVSEPLQVGWYYDEVPEVAIINGWIDSDTGQFTVTARINERSLVNANGLSLSVESRVATGADGFCLPSRTYSQTPVSTGAIPENLKSADHYHLDAIRWIEPPTITGDTMRFSGKSSPGLVRLTWREGYCSQFRLYEHDDRGYHQIDAINPLLPSDRSWTDPYIAEVISQHTTADGTFDATVNLSPNALNKYLNPVLVVESSSRLDSVTNECGDSDALSAINIRSSTAILSPTPTPAPASTPAPSATPAPALTPSPQPQPTATPPPSSATTSLRSLHNTENMRWLQSVHPALYRQVQELTWVKDGLSERERETLDELLYIGVGEISNLESVLALPWLQDEVSDTEYDALYWLQALDYENTTAAASLISMPFLESLDPEDVLAIRGMHSLAHDGWLSALIGHPTLQDGISDLQTTLVAAASTMQNSREITRMFDPGYAHIETFSSGTALTPDLKISIVRTGTQPQPWTAEYLANAVGFAETTMQQPLPVSHVITVLNDNAVTGGSAGTNHGNAISYKPEYEEGQYPYDRYEFQAGLVHEVAHYYWSGNDDWIDEGLANVFEFSHGINSGIGRGLLKNRRDNCEVHDLEMLSGLNPDKADSQFICNYYLGQLLFQELWDNLGAEEFNQRLGELYRLSLALQEEQETSGISEVRQAFQGQADIVEKHWSGKLNAPENRPYDQMAGIVSHDLVEWEKYPLYERGTVKLEGKLLEGATFQDVDLKNPSEGGLYFSTFTISNASEIDFAGSILPGNDWVFDPGDAGASAHHYYPATNTFILEFPFPEVLGEPSNYAIVVWGFPDHSRTPFTDEDIDILGYARIRVE